MQQPLILQRSEATVRLRYFVEMKTPSAGRRVEAARTAGKTVGRVTQRDLARATLASQRSAVAAARAAGGKVAYRYSKLLNAFSLVATPRAADDLALRPDVARVVPVGISRRQLFSSVPFIHAPQVWQEHDSTGEGIRIAVVDTGVDYTHADFSGPGTTGAYNANDPEVIEAGTFPTARVIDGYDFVGSNYSVDDNSASNDTPQPDPDPLDEADVGLHGTHVAGICCGSGVPGLVGPGVAPDSKILAYRVWDADGSTADVLVAAFERAMDPNDDGSMSDAVDIIQFSGGVDYGSQSSLEAQAAQQAVDLGTTFVAAAGNASNKAAGGSPYILGTPASAPGVIAVAASTDHFQAQVTKIRNPKGEKLPSNGQTVPQDWSPAIGDDFTGLVVDARRFDEPSGGSAPDPEDRLMCKKIEGKPFEGKIALVFKGSADDGDCDGSVKVLHAQQAGASAVMLWSGFNAPFVLGPGKGVKRIQIPAWMIGSNGGRKLGRLASPQAPDRYSTRKVKVTVKHDLSTIPGFGDQITDFSSQGPERESNSLKPDIAAPGSTIRSAKAGSGDGSIMFDGTSMAAPHISGVAALLLQLHPDWTPAQVKAVLMNQAKSNLSDANGGSPVPATIQGAGRVRADESADAVSMAVPGSLSFGRRAQSGPTDLPTQSVTVTNFDVVPHDYSVDTNLHHSDFEGDVASAQVSTDAITFGDTASFTLAPSASQMIHVRLHVDPTQIQPAEQEAGFYFAYPDIDGAVNIHQTLGSDDDLRVPWHVVLLAASDNSTSGELNVPVGGSADLSIAAPVSAGVDHADIYLLDEAGQIDSGGEDDITHVGARSFVGPTVGDAAVGLPAGADPYQEIDWVTFLTNDDEPTEPIEFAFRSAAVHSTTEAYEANVVIDVGNDGTFADQELKGDFLAVKTASGNTCLIDLSASDQCARRYYPDYSNFNTNLSGIVVDARDLGLTTGSPNIGYYYELCTEAFAGDVPTPVCESAGRAGNGEPQFEMNVTDPPVEASTLVCEGFFGGPSCGQPISITDSGGGNNQDLLVLFPNNPPDQNVQVVDIK